MTEAFMGTCKATLSNLISSERIQESEDPLASFSKALLNFYPHYCLDVHTSSWCHHEKVMYILIKKHHTFFLLDYG